MSEEQHMRQAAYLGALDATRERDDQIAALRAERDEAMAELSDIDAELPELFELDERGDPDEDRPVRLAHRAAHVAMEAASLQADLDEARAEAGRWKDHAESWEHNHGAALDQRDAVAAQRDELAAALEDCAAAANIELNRKYRGRTFPAAQDEYDREPLQIARTAALALLARLRGEGEG